MFAGRKVANLLVFVVAGLVSAEIGASVGLAYAGPTGAFLGGVFGFALGGLLSVALLPLAVGLGLGYLGYAISLQFTSVELVSLFLALEMFVIGVLLTGRLLILVSVVLGGLILFDLSLAVGLAGPVAAFGVFLLAASGFFIQNWELSSSRRNPVVDRR